MCGEGGGGVLRLLCAGTKKLMGGFDHSLTDRGSKFKNFIAISYILLIYIDLACLKM